MIPFDFAYYKPSSVMEVVQTLQEIKSQGKTAVLYSGGTEFITLSRMNQITADAVIDLKGIPECNVLEKHGETLVIGACVSLNKMIESNLFPLLGQTVTRIADHTSRNKITIGGNLNSRLIYREAILPLLLTEAEVKIAAPQGEITLPIVEVFDKEMKLGEGQFLIRILVQRDYVDQPFVHIKRTRFSKVGYPIVSIAALVKDKWIRTAFSGVCDYPFRSRKLEVLFNDSSLSVKEKIDKAVQQLPAPIIDDILAAQDYREFVFKNTLEDTLESLKEATS